MHKNEVKKMKSPPRKCERPYASSQRRAGRRVCTSSLVAIVCKQENKQDYRQMSTKRYSGDSNEHTYKHILSHKSKSIHTYNIYIYIHTYMRDRTHSHTHCWCGIDQIFNAGPVWYANYCLLIRCFFSNLLKHVILPGFFQYRSGRYSKF